MSEFKLAGIVYDTLREALVDRDDLEVYKQCFSTAFEVGFEGKEYIIRVTLDE